MRRRCAFLLAFLMLSGWWSLEAQAEILFSEYDSGPLSTNPLAPTPLVLQTPSDEVLGAPEALPNENYFTFLVPPGTAVSSLVFAPTTSGLTEIYTGTTADAANLQCFGLVFAPTDILDGSNCPAELSGGNSYTIRFGSPDGTAWTLTIGGTVPVELQRLSVE